MAYIDPTTISDEHFRYLYTNFGLAEVIKEADLKINAVCRKEGVPVPSIPTDDQTGFVTSIPLQVYGKQVYKKFAFIAYWGKRNGSEDIYRMKLDLVIEGMNNARIDVTKDTICDSTVEDTEPPKDFAYTSSSPY